MKVYKCENCGENTSTDLLRLQNNKYLCLKCVDKNKPAYKTTGGSFHNMLFDCN